MGRNSTNEDECCTFDNTFTTVNTALIGNPIGLFQIFDDVLPSVDNTYNIGSNALRWKNGYYTTSLFSPQLVSSSTDLTLDAATGFSVVSKKSIVPDQDILHYSGFGNKRWLEVHGQTIITDTVTTLTGTDLILSPFSGQVIQNTRTIRPSTNLGNDLGTPSFRYANVYGQTLNSTTINNTTLNTTTANATTVSTTTVNTTNVNATTSQNLALAADSGFIITANRDLQPLVNSTTNLGSASKKWQTVYTNNITTTTVNTGSVVTNSISANPSVDLSLFADSGKSIILNNPLLPVTDNTIPLGTAIKQWSDIRATQSTIASMNATTLTMNNTITTPTGIDLNLTAATGRNVVASQTLRPAADDTQNSGDSSQRWATVHAVNTSTNNITSYSSRDLTLSTTTAAFSIIPKRDVLPEIDNTLDLGSLSNRWRNIIATSVGTPLVSSPFGSNLELQAPSVNVISAKSTVYPFDNLVQSLGATGNRWLNVYGQTIVTDTVTSPTSTDLTLNPATGKDLVSTKSFFPSVTATHSLGSSLKTWLNFFCDTATTPIVASPSGSLTLSPPSGQSVVAQGTVRPSTDIAYDLGTASIRWNNTYTKNLTVTDVTVTTVSSPAGTDLTLNPSTGQNLISTKSFLPNTTLTHSLGTSLKTWLNGFFDVVTSTFYKAPADKQGTSFQTSSAVLSANVFTTAAISISAGTFDAGSNQLKFPVNGVYCIDFTSVGDIGVTDNTILYHLKNTNGGGTTLDQYHRIGDTNYSPGKQRLSFMFRCNDSANDKIVIEYLRTVTNVSNWTISEGYCYCVNTFS